jgi:hypothetical protein
MSAKVHISIHAIGGPTYRAWQGGRPTSPLAGPEPQQRPCPSDFKFQTLDDETSREIEDESGSGSGAALRRVRGRQLGHLFTWALSLVSCVG